MAASTTAFVEVTPKQRRQAERKRLRVASLHARLAWWASKDRYANFQASELSAETRRLQKEITKLSKITPTTTWFDDSRSLPQDAGGEFPPRDAIGLPLMQRGIGERCYYPRPYIVTSGHSYDTFIIAFTTGESPLLLEHGKRFRVSRHEVLYLTGRAELPDPGYLGSVVRVGQLHAVDQKRLRKAESQVEGTLDGHEITNVF